jgi:hypothetical protein
MVELDDSVANLERFCESLQRTIDQLGDLTPNVESARGDLDELEDEAGSRIGEWSTALEEARSELESGYEDARHGVEDLATAAEDFAQQRLGAVSNDLEAAGRSSQERSDRAEQDLQEGFDRAASEGFQGYADALHEVEGQAAAAEAETTQAFEAFGDRLEDLGTDADQAGDRAGQAMDQAGGQARGDAGELATAFDAVTAEWASTIDEQLRQGSEAVGGALTDAYDGWGQQAAAVAEQLGDKVAELMQDAAAFVSPEGAEALNTAVETGLDDRGGPLVEELQSAGVVLEGGEVTAQALQPLSADLQRSLAVVDEIERLLKAMES